MFEYVPGSANVVADALSRPPVAAVELFSVSDPHVVSQLSKWLAVVAPHVSLANILNSACTSLAAGRTLGAVRCPHCSALHVDTGTFATRKHVQHLCTTPDCG